MDLSINKQSQMKKKLLDFWRTVTFRWIKSDVADPKSYLKVEILNEESNILHEVLGITEERREALTKRCEVLLTKYDDTSQSAMEMSREILHANELFYCAYLMSHMIETKKRLGGLAAMMMGSQRPGGPRKPD